NAQREHQEFMHTVEAVAIENGQVFLSLPADGIAIFPADEPYADVWRELAGKRRVLTFGQTAQADFYAESVVQDPLGISFVMKTTSVQIDVGRSIAGAHNVRNSLAAAACAYAAGIDLAHIREG